MSNSLLRGGENSPTGYGRNEATSARAILPSSKFHRQQQQLFLFLSISIFYILFSSILFSWVMVRLWFGFYALPEGVSALLVFAKTVFFRR
jgi:flagellar biogenesis protein FliO